MLPHDKYVNFSRTTDSRSTQTPISISIYRCRGNLPRLASTTHWRCGCDRFHVPWQGRQGRVYRIGMGSLAVGLGAGRDAMGWSDSETLSIASASAAGKVWSDHGAATVLRRFAMNLWSTRMASRCDTPLPSSFRTYDTSFSIRLSAMWIFETIS